MTKFKAGFLFFAAVAVAVWALSGAASAQDDLQIISTSDAQAENVAVPGPNTGELEEKETIHGKVFTVPAGGDQYIPYSEVHGTLSRDGHIIAEFFTDENGEFVIIGLPAGDWEVMAEQEHDEVFGSSEVTVTYDLFHEETLILFLNNCGLARFPSEFDSSLPIAENSVKYWQYVSCTGAGSKTPQDPTAYKKTASDAYATACNTCSQCSYDPCGTCYSCCCQPCCNPFGALGLLGLLGLIGLIQPPVSAF